MVTIADTLLDQAYAWYSLVLAYESTRKPYGYWVRAPLDVSFSWEFAGLKEGLFSALDANRDFRRIAAFEDGLGKPKSLL